MYSFKAKPLHSHHKRGRKRSDIKSADTVEDERQVRNPKAHNSTAEHKYQFLKKSYFTYPVRHGEGGVVEHILHGLLKIVDLGTVPREEMPPIVDISLSLGGRAVVAVDLRLEMGHKIRAFTGMPIQIVLKGRKEGNERAFTVLHRPQ